MLLLLLPHATCHHTSIHKHTHRQRNLQPWLDIFNTHRRLSESSRRRQIKVCIASSTTFRYPRKSCDCSVMICCHNIYIYFVYNSSSAWSCQPQSCLGQSVIGVEFGLIAAHVCGNKRSGSKVQAMCGVTCNSAALHCPHSPLFSLSTWRTVALPCANFIMKISF